MKKFNKLFVIIFIILVSSFIVFIINITYNYVHGKNIVNYEWLSHNVKLVYDDDLGQNIYVIDKDRNIDIYNSNYRKVIDKKIEYLTSSKYTFNSPLIIYNLYGTNNLSLNVFFDTEEAYYVDYTISCDNKDIIDFTRTLYNEGKNNLTKSHKYQIIGLIKGYKNVVTLNLRDKDGSIVNTKKIEIDLSNLYTGSNLILANDNKTSNYDNNNYNGLYTVFGNGLYISMYDNNGVLRSEIPINSYRGNRILFYNNNIIFSISNNKFVILDRFGRIDRVINTSKYLIHHDYKLHNNSIVFLATNKDKDSIEDVVVKYNLNTNKLIKILDVDTLFKDYIKSIHKTNTTSYDEFDKGFDWIHINSFIYDNDSIILSSRELSSIIKVININSKPKIKYILSDKSIWEDTKYEDLVYDKKGDFKSHAGQSDISIKGNINNSSYYIRLFNSNYGKSNNKIDYSKFDIDNNSISRGDNSYYYNYKIDEKTNSYELIDKLELPYTAYNGSIDLYNNNYLFNTKNNTFLVYDNNKKLLHKYKVNSDNNIYRVYKYNYCKYWYK